MMQDEDEFDQEGLEEEFLEIKKRFEQAKEEGIDVFFEADDLNELYDYYIEHFEFEQAEYVVEFGLIHYPLDVNLLLRKAEQFIHDENFAQAQYYLEKIEPLAPRDPEMLLLKAMILTHKGDNKQAIDTLHQIDIKEFFGDAFLMGGLVETYVELDELASAEACYMYQIEQALIEFDLAELEEGDREQNISEMDGYCFSLILFSHSYSRGEACLQFFDHKLNEYPYCLPLWFAKTGLHIHADQYDKAFDAIDYILAIDPENFDAYLTRVSCFSELDQQDKAIALLESMLDLFSSDFAKAEIYSLLGEKNAESENYSLAKKYYLLAKEYNSDSEILLGLSSAMYNLKEYGPAMVLIRSLVENQPNPRYYQYIYAQYLADPQNLEQDFALAQQILEKLIDSTGYSLEYLLPLSRIYIEQSRIEEFYEYTMQLTLDPNTILEFSVLYALALYFDNRKEQAYIYFIDAFAMNTELASLIRKFYPDLLEDGIILEMVLNAEIKDKE